jgi:anti-sigma factor RsiW
MIHACLDDEGARRLRLVGLKPTPSRGIQVVSAMARTQHARSSSMTCREFADFIMDYLSAELSAESRTHFEHHLGICDNCRKYLTSYQESVKLGRRAFDDDNASLPADVPQELVKAILAARRSA